MSKLNDLIKKLCPNGVEYKIIKDITSVLRGKRLTTKELIANAKFPVYHGGLEPLGYYNKTNRVGDTVMIINVGASAGTVGYSKNDFWSSDGCYCIEHSSLLLNRYLYHYLKNNENYFIGKVRKAGIPTLDGSVIEKFAIPIPPIKVQKEIVRILDKFGELEMELEAELEARKSQYEFWREIIINKYQCSKMKLLDISKIYDGTHSTPNYQSKGVPFISVENINNIYDSKKYISKDDFNKFKIKPMINDVFMTRIGSIGVCAVFDKQIDLAYYVSLALIRPNTEIVLPKYLKYVIESNIGKNELYKRTLVYAVPIKINKDDIGKIVLPIPSLSDQREIIKILNIFELLTNSFTVGIPAEIEARRKQYEYYRNKLLSFEEVPCE